MFMDSSASGGKESQIAAIAGVFEDFWGMEKRRRARGDGGARSLDRWAVRVGEGVLVVHKNLEKLKIVLIVEKFC